MTPTKEEFRDNLLRLIAERKELNRRKKKNHSCNEADIHVIENAQRIRKRTRRKGGTSYDASNY